MHNEGLIIFNCIDDNCPVLSILWQKRKKEIFDLEHTVKIQHSQLGDHVLQSMCLNSRLENDTHSAWWLVLIRTLRSRPSAWFLTIYLWVGKSKSSMSLVREQGKSGGHSRLTEELYLHSLLQAGHVPHAAAAGTAVHTQPAAAASPWHSLRTSQPNRSFQGHKKKTNHDKAYHRNQNLSKKGIAYAL